MPRDIICCIRNRQVFLKAISPIRGAIVSVIRDVVSRYDNALLTLSETEKFPFNEEECAASIYQMIDCNTYSPFPNTAFAIKKKDGVDRVVEQLPFKDLIIQQYLLKTISPIFDRFFRRGIHRVQKKGYPGRSRSNSFRQPLRKDIVT